jgi:hypothetical protein
MKTKAIIFMLLFCNLINAQNSKSFLIGGAIGYRYSDDNSKIETANSIDYREHLIQLKPAAGYFITNWLVAGLGFEYYYDDIKYDDYFYYTTKETGFSIDPFIRLYAPFGLFLHTEFDYGLAKSKYEGESIAGPTGFISTNFAADLDLIGYSIGLGYTIKIKESIGIETSVRYLNGRFDDKDDKYDFNRKGILLNIGMVCYLKPRGIKN